ncbi:uncharacterized protein LOC106661680 [Cimex lectularius]|uniref:Uncharacterized protein n=1 Tax=Cimex lectularius TaxID=79782 RepID=A0A8I6RE17_CIMLE|nr:uncharacterized protein LOC106661680 [Cimex lectularius]
MNFYYIILTIALFQVVKARSVADFEDMKGLILGDEMVLQPPIQSLSIFDSCLNLSTSLEDALHLSWKMISWAYEKSQVISSDLVKISECTGFTTIPCIQGHLSELKKDLGGLTTPIRKFQHDASKLLWEIKDEVLSCI